MVKRLLILLFVSLLTSTLCFAQEYKYNPFTNKLDITNDLASEISFSDPNGYFGTSASPPTVQSSIFELVTGTSLNKPYVPYTGANSNVDIGTYTFTASRVIVTTDITFNNASGDQTLKFDDATQDFVFSDDVNVQPGADGASHLLFDDDQDKFELYADANQFYLNRYTGSKELLRFGVNNEAYFSQGKVAIGSNKAAAYDLEVAGVIKSEMTGAAGTIILNRTDGKSCSVAAGANSGTFRFDDSGGFDIQSQPSADLLSNSGGNITSRLFIDGSTGNVGIGTSSPDFKLALITGSNSTIGIDRRGGTTNAGNILILQGGGPSLGGTDLNGGNLRLSSGISTGNGTSGLELYTVPPNQGAGTTDRNPVQTGAVNGNGTFTELNNIALEGLGLPAIHDNLSLTNQSADITATAFTNAGVAGQYRVNYYLLTTTSDATAGSIILTIAFTDAAGATTVTSSSLPLTATGRTSGVFYVQLASGSITYAVAVTGAYNNARYALYANCERLN